MVGDRAGVRASTMSDLFGDEARELTKLLNNMELMPEMLGMVADETQYLGSSEAEYAERSKTTANNMQLARNQMTRLGVSIGEVVLPALNELLTKSQVFIDKMVIWTKEHPKLTKWLVIGGLALGAMAVAGGVLLTVAAGLIGTLAVLRFGLVGLGARAMFAGGGVSNLSGRFGRLGRMRRFRLARLITPLRWGASLIPAINWGSMFGRLGRFGMNASGWGRLITPLKWLGRGAMRFIPVIGWAILAAEIGYFAWNSIIKPLGWDKYLSRDGLVEGLNGLTPGFEWGWIIDQIRWTAFLPVTALMSAWKVLRGEATWRDIIEDIPWMSWFNFEWIDLLPSWDWSAIIPDFNLGGMFAAVPGAASEVPGGAAPFQRGADRGYGGERALGGPVAAGRPYLVNENTPRSEIFVPSTSGGILNVSQAQSVMRKSLQGGGRIRAAGLAALTSSALVGSAAAMPSSGAPVGQSTTTRVEIGSIQITAPSGVSDPEGLVNLLEARLGDRISATLAASFSD